MSLTVSTPVPIDRSAVAALGFDDALVFAKGEARRGPGGGVYGHSGFRVGSRVDPLVASPDQALVDILTRIKDVQAFEEWSRRYKRWMTVSVTALSTKPFLNISNQTLRLIAGAGLDLDIVVKDLFDPERPVGAGV